MNQRRGSHARRSHYGIRFGRRALLVGAAGGAAYGGYRGWPRSDDAETPGRASDGSSSPSGAPEKRFPGDPGSGLYFGISLQISQGLEDRVRQIGATPSLTRRFYRDHQLGLMSAMAAADLAAGAIPFMSVKLPGSWTEVADGGRDDWVDEMLDGLNRADGPVFLSLHHEPENDTAAAGHTPAAWQDMHRRARDRAESRAPAVTVVPVLMQWTFNPDSGRSAEPWLMRDFPLLGVDVYNNWSPTDDKVWSEFSELLGQVRQQVGTGQALIVPEFGTPEDPLDPNRAAQWMRTAYDTALAAGVVGLAWFDSPYNNPAVGDTRLSEVGRLAMRDLIERTETARLST